MKKALRNNGLSLFFGLIFLLALLGQALTGHALFNEEQVASGLEEISFGQYLVSSNFAVDVAENWQSEYLQFLLYIFVTVWLVQKGSPESKELDEPGPESDEEQKVGEYADAGFAEVGPRSRLAPALYSNSLGLVMGLIFLAVLAGPVDRRRRRLQRGTARALPGPGQLGAVPRIAGLLEPNPAELAVRVPRGRLHGVLSIYLRQRGSPESKPVGSAHDDTGTTG